MKIFRPPLPPPIAVDFGVNIWNPDIKIIHVQVHIDNLNI
jgi:hypothetical protein